MTSIAVIGAGAWGTALAQTMADGERGILLWAREPEVVESVNARHENETFLPGVALSPSIRATGSLTEAARADVVLIVTPAQHVRSTFAALRGHMKDGAPAVICAKGIEMKSGLLLSQVAAEEAPGIPVAALTGPTFASEIARGLPSAVTVAANEKPVAERVRDAVASRTLRPYVADDLTGAQIGGAVKNVIAIAAGIVTGRGLGDSARAALITRGLAEMARLATALGAKRETLMGMCGVGDLVLTCSSMQSRNFSLGAQLGEGRSLDDILGARKSVTEGVYTAQALSVMAKKQAVDMPICEAVNRCLNEGAGLDAVIEGIMERPIRQKAESQ